MSVYLRQAGPPVRGHLHVHGQPSAQYRHPGAPHQHPGGGGAGGGPDIHRYSTVQYSTVQCYTIKCYLCSHEQLLVHPRRAPGPRCRHPPKVSGGKRES